jgi:hypothetical protein
MKGAYHVWFSGGEYRGGRAKRVRAGAVESYAGGRERGVYRLSVGESHERTFQIFAQLVQDIQRQRLQAPLVWVTLCDMCAQNGWWGVVYSIREWRGVPRGAGSQGRHCGRSWLDGGGNCMQ